MEIEGLKDARLVALSEIQTPDVKQNDEDIWSDTMLALTTCHTMCKILL